MLEPLNTVYWQNCHHRGRVSILRHWYLTVQPSLEMRTSATSPESSTSTKCHSHLVLTSRFVLMKPQANSNTRTSAVRGARLGAQRTHVPRWQLSLERQGCFLSSDHSPQGRIFEPYVPLIKLKFLMRILDGIQRSGCDGHLTYDVHVSGPFPTEVRKTA